MSRKLFPYNYWYSARENEIFLDLDSNRAVSRAFSVLRVAIRKKKLAIQSVWLYSTPTKNHAHMIIVLFDPYMDARAKIAWSLWLGNDRLRCAYVLMREAMSGTAFNDLLVTTEPYYRRADAQCLCTEKHKDPKVTDVCPAMEALLGEHRSADYFARTGKSPSRKKIRVPWGRVSLTQIRNWKDTYERGNRKKRLLQNNRDVEGLPEMGRGSQQRLQSSGGGMEP